MRKGRSKRAVAREFDVPLSTVQHWVKRAARQRLDRVDWSDRPAGVRRPDNRTSGEMEDRIEIRQILRKESALGEFGAQAIRRELLRLDAAAKRPPSVRTIGRVLARRGALDGRVRVRRPPPPRGWFLPDVAAGRAEMDSVDIIEDLKIRGGEFVHVLTLISLYGALCEAWPKAQITAKNRGPGPARGSDRIPIVRRRIRSRARLLPSYSPRPSMSRPKYARGRRRLRIVAQRSPLRGRLMRLILRPGHIDRRVPRLEHETLAVCLGTTTFRIEEGQ